MWSLSCERRNCCWNSSPNFFLLRRSCYEQEKRSKMVSWIWSVKKWYSWLHKKWKAIRCRWWNHPKNYEKKSYWQKFNNQWTSSKMSRSVSDCSPWLREQPRDFCDAGIKNFFPGSLSELWSMVTTLKSKYRSVVKVLQGNKKNAF
jgi:hypothetical protein